MDGKWIKDLDWTNAEIEILNTHSFLSAKPVVYLVNVSEDDFIKKRNKWLPKIDEYIKTIGGGKMIPYSATYEHMHSLMEEEEESKADDIPETKEGEEDPKKPKSMLSKIIKQGYKALNLINFFTVGADEVRSWTIQGGTTAKRAAGVIHTDFEQGFV